MSRKKKIVIPQNTIEKKRRGRPPGAKNKPKLPASADVIKNKVRAKKAEKAITKKAKETKPAKKELKVVEKEQLTNTEEAGLQLGKDDILRKHCLFPAAEWLEKKMHPAELAYYKKEARRRDVPVLQVIIGDMLGFFNIRDEDLLKIVKKNHYVVNYSNIT